MFLKLRLLLSRIRRLDRKATSFQDELRNNASVIRMEEFMLDYLREEFAAYSNELIIIGVLIIAFVSFYSRFFLKSSKKKNTTNR